MLKRKILWEPDPDPEASLVIEAPPPIAVAEAPPPVHKSGNGHKILKVRDLESHEKDKILNELFVPRNGMIGKDICVQFKAQKLPGEVAIFQVTGYVTTLHNKVARGDLRVHDTRAYENFMKSHRNLWKTYDSEKYRAMRNRPGGQQRSPEFAAFPANKKVA